MPAAEIIPVITIDGPTGSGKGTVSHRVATALGFWLLDSGALYRVLALAARRRGISCTVATALAPLAQDLEITFIGGDAANPLRVQLAGTEVTDKIRTEQCASDASRISAHPEVRAALLMLQHRFRQSPGLVADGRDMGSVVFPDAMVKVFLTATAQTRAERRYKQLMTNGVDVTVARVLGELTERDRRDRERAIAPLEPAGDAVVVDTTGVDVDTVVTRVLELVAARTAAMVSAEKYTPDASSAH